VLHELISNADQFTHQGTITLGVAQPDKHSVCFSVTDTGSGISDRDKDHVFNLFYKPDEFAEGLGLGLSLCRKAIDQMGGNIRIDEAYTTGTRIIITLPLDN
jgi:signal transduction histidine kinase